MVGDPPLCWFCQLIRPAVTCSSLHLRPSSSCPSPLPHLSSIINTSQQRCHLTAVAPPSPNTYWLLANREPMFQRGQSPCGSCEKQQQESPAARLQVDRRQTTRSLSSGRDSRAGRRKPARLRSAAAVKAANRPETLPVRPFRSSSAEHDFICPYSTRLLLSVRLATQIRLNVVRLLVHVAVLLK